MTRLNKVLAVVAIAAVTQLASAFAQAAPVNSPDLSGSWRNNARAQYTITYQSTVSTAWGTFDAYNYTLWHPLYQSHGVFLVGASGAITCKKHDGTQWDGKLNSPNHMTWFNAPGLLGPMTVQITR